MPAITGLRTRNFFALLPILVVVIDQAVVGRLEAIEFLDLAADGERGEQHVVAAVGGRRFIFAGVQHFERIAGLHLALEIDVVGVDADQFVDDRPRNLVAQRGLVDALIEPHAGRVVFVVRLRSFRRHRYRRSSRRPTRICRYRTARPPRRSGVAGDDDADRLQRWPPGHRRHQHAQLLAFLDAAVAAARAEHAR